MLSFAPAFKQGGLETAVVSRQGLFSLEVEAQGTPQTDPADPLSAGLTLEALATLSKRLAVHIVEEDEDVTVVPISLHTDKVQGQLRCSVQSFHTQTAINMTKVVPEELKGVALRTLLREIYPPLLVKDGLQELLTNACEILGRPILGVSRAQPNQVSLWADKTKVLVDGLGLIGSRTSYGREYYDPDSCITQAEVGLSVALACLHNSICDHDYMASFAEYVRSQE
jgi:hypothetical protein